MLLPQTTPLFFLLFFFFLHIISQRRLNASVVFFSSKLSKFTQNQKTITDFLLLHFWTSFYLWLFSRLLTLASFSSKTFQTLSVSSRHKLQSLWSCSGPALVRSRSLTPRVPPCPKSRGTSSSSASPRQQPAGRRKHRGPWHRRGTPDSGLRRSRVNNVRSLVFRVVTGGVA